MPERRKSWKDSQHAMSQPGFLATLTGCGLLYVYFKFGHLAKGVSDSARWLFLCAAGLLVVWGAVQIIGEGLQLSRGRRKNGSESSRSRRVSVSWLGIFLMLLGFAVLDAAGVETVDGFTSALLYGLGAVLVVWGLREIVGKLMPTLATRRLQTRRMLTEPGLVYLAMMIVMFVGSFLGQENLLMLVGALMIGPFVLNGWVTYSMLKRLALARSVPPRAVCGEMVAVDVVVENRKRLLASWLIAVCDRIENAEESLEAEVVLARVPPRSRRGGQYHLRPMRRGRYRFGPLEARTRFPLGLVERGVTVSAADELLVYPRLGQLTPAWRREFETADELVHRPESRPGTFDDEFHRIREYRPGDNPRAIHWRTSARQGALMVREFHESRERNLTLLVDLWLPERPTDDDLERVELAVSFAATIGVERLRAARETVLSLGIAGRGFVEWEAAASSAGIESLLARLAEVEAGSAAALAPLAEFAVRRRARGAQAMFITTGKMFGRVEQWERALAECSSSELLGERRIFSTERSALERYFTV
ncbi:MAG: DUF58 domain-containing protein [Planctomycetes bacterium]|nr:DUF58 domain-containing protein [Planctomycetota bacterium]